MKRNILTICLLLLGLVALFSTGPQAGAATEDEIEQAVASGVAWLAGEQNGDGSWGSGGYLIAKTCFVLTKLQERAYDLGVVPQYIVPENGNLTTK